MISLSLKRTKFLFGFGFFQMNYNFTCENNRLGKIDFSHFFNLVDIFISHNEDNLLWCL